MVGEPGDVVVHTDVAGIDRGDLMAGHQGGGRGVELAQIGGDVGLEQPVADRPRQQHVVESPEHVSFRVSLGEQGFVDHRAGVAGSGDGDGDPGGLGEGGESLGFDEGVVGQQCD